MLYPAVQPQEHGHLQASHGQKIYWEALGDKKGEPIVMLHGGPGAGCSSFSRRFFDLKKYRVILFDQRGCARSAQASLPSGGAQEQTLKMQMLGSLSFQNMIQDMELLRAHLSIDRWSVFGGSWGTTLALGYAQQFPHRVKKMLLRGVFTSTEEEINWLYSKKGAAQMFPLEWQRFYSALLTLSKATGQERLVSSKDLAWQDILGVFYRIFCEGSAPLQALAATAWGSWEQSIMSLPSAGASSEADHLRNFEMGLISCHLFLKDPVLLSNRLWDQMQVIESIPCDIVQGQFDAVTPAKTAWRLTQELKDCRLQLVRQAGHASSDPDLSRALIRVLDEWVF